MGSKVSCKSALRLLAGAIQICRVENVEVEERRRWFKKDTFFHRAPLGKEYLRFDFDSKQVIQSSDSRKWSLLFKYDEFNLNKEDGIIDFYESGSYQCIASFYLDDNYLNVFNKEGWKTYTVESSVSLPEPTEEREAPRQCDPKVSSNCPTQSTGSKEHKRSNVAEISQVKKSPVVQKTSRRKAAGIKHGTKTVDEAEQVICRFLSNEEQVRSMASASNKELKELIGAVLREGYSLKDANMIARMVIRRARALAK